MIILFAISTFAKAESDKKLVGRIDQLNFFQEEEQEFKDTLLSLELIKEIENKDEKKEFLSLKKFNLQKYQKKNYITREELKTFWTSKYKLKTAPFKVLLLKGSKAYDLIEEKNIIISEEIFATARLNSSNTDEVEILDKKNRPRLTTKYKNIAVIEEDLNIMPKPEIFTTYRNYKYKKDKDHSFTLLSSVHLQKEYLNTGYYNDFFNTNIVSATGSRISFKTLYQTAFKINLGFIGDYEFGKINSNHFKYKYRTIIFGPIFEWNFFKNKTISTSINLSLQKTIGFKIQNTNKSYNFSHSVYQAGIQGGVPIKTGDILLNLSLKKMKSFHDGKADGTINNNPDKDGYYSYSFGLGYRFKTIFL